MLQIQCNSPVVQEKSKLRYPQCSNKMGSGSLRVSGGVRYSVSEYCTVSQLSLLRAGDPPTVLFDAASVKNVTKLMLQKAKSCLCELRNVVLYGRTAIASIVGVNNKTRREIISDLRSRKVEQIYEQ